MDSNVFIQIGEKKLNLYIDQLPSDGTSIIIDNCVDGISGKLKIISRSYSLIGSDIKGNPLFSVTLYAEKAS